MLEIIAQTAHPRTVMVPSRYPTPIHLEKDRFDPQPVFLPIVPQDSAQHALPHPPERLGHPNRHPPDAEGILRVPHQVFRYGQNPTGSMHNPPPEHRL